MDPQRPATAVGDHGDKTLRGKIGASIARPYGAFSSSFFTDHGTRFKKPRPRFVASRIESCNQILCGESLLIPICAATIRESSNYGPEIGS